jgi:prefoldin subunit 2
VSELQMQYSNFKDTLQNIASQIGNVEQEVEEHKYVASGKPLIFF